MHRDHHQTSWSSVAVFSGLTASSNSCPKSNIKAPKPTSLYSQSKPFDVARHMDSAEGVVSDQRVSASCFSWGLHVHYTGLSWSIVVTIMLCFSVAPLLVNFLNPIRSTIARSSHGQLHCRYFILKQCWNLYHFAFWAFRNTCNDYSAFFPLAPWSPRRAMLA